METVPPLGAGVKRVSGLPRCKEQESERGQRTKDGLIGLGRPA